MTGFELFFWWYGIGFVFFLCTFLMDIYETRLDVITPFGIIVFLLVPLLGPTWIFIFLGWVIDRVTIPWAKIYSPIKTVLHYPLWKRKKNGH